MQNLPECHRHGKSCTSPAWESRVRKLCQMSMLAGGVQRCLEDEWMTRAGSIYCSAHRARRHPGLLLAPLLALGRDPEQCQQNHPTRSHRDLASDLAVSWKMLLVFRQIKADQQRVGPAWDNLGSCHSAGLLRSNYQTSKKGNAECEVPPPHWFTSSVLKDIQARPLCKWTPFSVNQHGLNLPPTSLCPYICTHLQCAFHTSIQQAHVTQFMYQTYANYYTSDRLLCP